MNEKPFIIKGNINNVPTHTLLYYTRRVVVVEQHLGIVSVFPHHTNDDGIMMVIIKFELCSNNKKRLMFFHFNLTLARCPLYVFL